MNAKSCSYNLSDTFIGRLDRTETVRIALCPRSRGLMSRLNFSRSRQYLLIRKMTKNDGDINIQLLV